jgi:hypothetical protein
VVRPRQERTSPGSGGSTSSIAGHPGLLMVDSHKRIINTSRLKKRVPRYKRQTASRRSVELKNVRDLHYADAAILF